MNVIQMFCWQSKKLNIKGLSKHEVIGKFKFWLDFCRMKMLFAFRPVLTSLECWSNLTWKINRMSILGIFHIDPFMVDFQKKNVLFQVAEGREKFFCYKKHCGFLENPPKKKTKKHLLLGGFKHFFCLTPIPGEMIQFDLRIFFKWVGEKPPTRLLSRLGNLRCKSDNMSRKWWPWWTLWLGFVFSKGDFFSDSKPW